MIKQDTIPRHRQYVEIIMLVFAMNKIYRISFAKDELTLSCNVEYVAIPFEITHTKTNKIGTIRRPARTFPYLCITGGNQTAGRIKYMHDAANIFCIRDPEAFERMALETFRFQAARCAPYREYLRRIGVRPEQVGTVGDIPFLPISLFKTHEVYCHEAAPEIVFTSSATTGMTAARHAMASLAWYERTFRAAFRIFYGDPAGWSLYGLLPNYLERQGSSLVYMVDRLLSDCGSGGFYLHDHERLLADMQADPKPKILLGVSYALWNLAERRAPRLENTVVMETGGMKGHREELPKEEFHKILCDAFGVEAIHSEYGMAELTSQAYSQGGNRFRTPGWMRVVARDVNDPFDLLPAGTRGGINVIDLANRWSCAFLQTEDIGMVFTDGSFTVEGRIDHADIRGCNLLVQ